MQLSCLVNISSGIIGCFISLFFYTCYVHRCIEITQNATRTAKGKSRALKSGLNQMADVRRAVRVRGKIGDKCLVMRLKFAVMKEFWF